MWDALTTARGKPGSPLKILLIGTLAPALTGWWHDLDRGRIGRLDLRPWRFAATLRGGINGRKFGGATRWSRRLRTAERCS